MVQCNTQMTIKHVFLHVVHVFLMIVPRCDGVRGVTKNALICHVLAESGSSGREVWLLGRDVSACACVAVGSWLMPWRVSWRLYA